MKETNMEHFRGEIEEILESSDDLPCLIDGKLQICKGNMDCCKCEFRGLDDCILSFVKWLMSPYKPEPVLTAREKHFVEFLQDGWLARDLKYNCFYWFKEKPTKGNEAWYCECSTWLLNSTLLEELFPFITWEDEEPWAVEELRKLDEHCGLIDEQPTAYDVKAVVEQLEKVVTDEADLFATEEINYDSKGNLIIRSTTDLHSYALRCLDKAIEIVKSGGAV